MCSSGSHVLYLGEKREVRAALLPTGFSEATDAPPGPTASSPHHMELSLVIQARSGASLGLQHDQDSPHSEY